MSNDSRNHVKGWLRIKHLALLVTLDESRNLHAASRHMNMSQPAASKMLKDIETFFGMTLFYRQPRSMEITDAGRKLGVANVSGVRRPVNLACVIGEGSVEDLIGTWVLIHVGFAMSKIDEDQAAETLRILTELGEAQQELAAMRDGDRALGDAQW